MYLYQMFMNDRSKNPFLLKSLLPVYSYCLRAKRLRNMLAKITYVVDYPGGFQILSWVQSLMDFMISRVNKLHDL